jgi:alpha-amylase
VLNHMTTDGGVSSAGNRYEKYSYPQFNQERNFNPVCKINNYHDRYNVQYCELGDPGTLADLRTSDEYVRSQQAAYLVDLLDLGVMGFRLDAAKHMPVEDLTDVLSKVARSRPGSNPYIFSEVINCDSSEPIKPAEYFAFGDVTEFNYGRRIGDVFRNGQLASLLDENRSWNTWGLLQSYDAVPFLNNHDTVRGPTCSDNILSYKDSSTYNIAQVFAFAWPYGNLVMTSGYAFTTTNQGPPLPNNDATDTGGPWRLSDTVRPTGCDGGSPWVCEHRWGNIAAMVGFRAATLGAWSADNRWSNGFQQIAFSRGSLGFVAINNENFAMNRDLQTGMPMGSYCQVLSGDFDLETHSCSGSTVFVRADGTTTVQISSKNAFAIHVGSKI